nr:hypothetical protein MACL_00000005 [Theileria orientalis]
MAIKSELDIKGTRLSGRVWKKIVKPIRCIISPNAWKLSKDKIREKWLKSKIKKEEIKEIAKESSEIIKKNREDRIKKGEQIRIKRQRKIENEIKSAGNNIIIVGSKKYGKMSKKAKKGLTKLTPEMVNILRSKRIDGSKGKLRECEMGSSFIKKIQVPGSLNVYRFDKVYRQGPATLVKNINKLPLQERIQNSVQKVTFLEVETYEGVPVDVGLTEKTPDPFLEKHLEKGVVPESIKEGINKQVKKLPASLLRAKGCERGDESTVEGKKNKRKKKKPENKESTKENEQLKKMESVEESGKGRKGGKKDGKVYKLKFRNFEGTIQEFKKLLDSNAKELGEYKKVNMRPNKIVVSFSDKKILERYLRHYNNYEHGEQKLKVAEMDYYETVKTDYKHLRLYGIPEEYDEKAVEEGLKRRISIEFKISKRKEEYKLEFRTVAECVKANAILNNSRIPLLKKKQETLVKVHTEMALFGAATRNSTRVFVRNLPFGTPEEDILEYFRRYDKKVKVHRPSKAKGFAFVSFSSLERARKVINELNGRMFNKRKIQLSMSLPKQLYDPKKEGSKEDPAEGMGDEKMIDDGSTDEKMIDDGMAVDGDSGEGEAGDGMAVGGGLGEGETGGGGKKKKVGKQSSSEDGSAKGSVESEKSKEDLEDTIFVRNLDYGCTEAELSEYFSKFGEVESSKIVLNEDKKSKGTAFVRFKRKEDVKKVRMSRTVYEILESEKLALLRDEQLSSEKPTLGIGFTLRGRRLKVDGALAKGRAKALKQHRDEEELRKYNEGKNMHLLMVGVPSEESPEYAKMTPEQREGLKEYLERKLEKIRQKNTYVNPKRLCIKNLPGNINSNDLREVILNHLKNWNDTRFEKEERTKEKKVKVKKKTYSRGKRQREKRRQQKALKPQ